MEEDPNEASLNHLQKIPSKSIYQPLRIIGAGTFSTVYEAVNKSTSELVAIKKLKLLSKSPLTELEILSSLTHPNIITLKSYYYSKSVLSKEKFLNIVTDFLPLTLSDTIHHYASQGNCFPNVLIKLYSYQLLSALRYLHSQNICHRDIKPANILINPKTHLLKLADFGSATILLSSNRNVSYVCSRHYRAPELIFGSYQYEVSVDMWSFGCVLSELFLGQPIFPGESSVDQLVEIVRVLGTPSREVIKEMNEEFCEFRLPEIKVYPFSRVFDGRIEREALELIGELLVYEPRRRLTATQAMKHKFFEKIRGREVKLPNGMDLPELVEEGIMFNF